MRLVSFAAVLLLVVPSFAQGIRPGALLVGDPLPVKELRNVINYPSKNLKFEFHNGKLTILVFWSTTCRGCIAFWPELQKLQEQFGKDLQVILVNMREDEKVVRDFLTARKKVSGEAMNLPISCRDSVLWTPFNRRGVPRYYWIDSEGNLASVTHRDQVTSENISRWIASGPIRLEQIIEDLYDVMGNKPIFVNGNGGDREADAFIWSSSLTTGFRDIAGSTTQFSDPLRGYSICLTGGSMAALYRTAYNNRMDEKDFFTFLHGSRFARRTTDSKVRYNYQLIAGRQMSRAQLQGSMQEDLNRFFGKTVKWEKRKKTCLVLKMFDSTMVKNKSKEYDCYVGDTETALDSATVHDAIVFMEQSAFFYDERPIVDETNYNGLLLGVRFKANCYNLKEFSKGLSKFGMSITEEPRDIDVLVVKDP